MQTVACGVGAVAQQRARPDVAGGSAKRRRVGVAAASVAVGDDSGDGELVTSATAVFAIRKAGIEVPPEPAGDASVEITTAYVISAWAAYVKVRDFVLTEALEAKKKDAEQYRAAFNYVKEYLEFLRKLIDKANRRLFAKTPSYFHLKKDGTCVLMEKTVRELRPHVQPKRK